MVDRAQPSLDNTPLARYFASAAAHAGGSGDGWVVPAGDDPNLLAEADSDVDHDPLNAFAESHSEDSLVVTIDPGAAYVGGAWLARDHYTRVELDEHQDGQGVWLGVDHEASDGLTIGLLGDFAQRDPRTRIWRFDTDGQGVTGVAADERSTDARIRDADLSGSVVTTDRYSHEFGTVSGDSMASESTETESFANTYVAGSAQLMVSQDLADDASLVSAVWDSWQTNADGEITGADIRYKITGGAGAINWTVTGVEVSADAPSGSTEVVLTVTGGESHSLGAGDSATYERADIDGTLDVDGTLTLNG